ncbi:MAG: AMP-binding protein [Thermoleophilaceae bacterium]|nr:AMP-binding protein [Thermoleophilaceae bacterium]
MRETRTTAAPLARMLDEAAEAHGQREAVVYGRERISYDELRESVDQLAAGLTARGITPGDPVAVVLGNVPAFAVAFFAVTRSGAAVPRRERSRSTSTTTRMGIPARSGARSRAWRCGSWTPKAPTWPPTAPARS